MSYIFPEAVIQVFCKAPIAGTVKTRLIPTLTATEAAELHIELTTNLLKLLYAANLCPIQLWCSPNPKHIFFQTLQQQFGVSLHSQLNPAALGARMEAAIKFGLQKYTQVLLVGCDCVSLTSANFESAILALQHKHEVVLAPTEDGGYILIGMSRLVKEVFVDTNMPWSSNQVFAITKNRLQTAKTKVYTLETQWDLDEPKDLRRYLKLNIGAHNRI